LDRDLAAGDELDPHPCSVSDMPSLALAVTMLSLPII